MSSHGRTSGSAAGRAATRYFLWATLGPLAIVVGLPLLTEVVTGQETGRFAEDSEESDEIETDRDSFTPATTTVLPGQTIVESAYSFVDNRSAYETHSFPELLVRFGVSEFLELRLGWNYEVGGVGSSVSGNVPEVPEEGLAALERESRVLYGGKLYLSRQRGWLPESSLILQGFTPTSGAANESKLTAAYVFGWRLPNDWVWDIGTRFALSGDDEDHFNVWAPSTVLKIPIGERWKAHVEYFGVLTEGRETEQVQHFFSPGAHYLISKDLEVGVRVGWGLNEQTPNFFSNVGFGWRF